MRSCGEIELLLSAALDGELTGEERAELDEHLSRCPACSALYEDLRQIRAQTAALEDLPAPPGFAQGVMARVAAEAQQAPAGAGEEKALPLPARGGKVRLWRRWGACAAAVAVVVLGASLASGHLGMGRSSGSASDLAGGAAAPEGASAGGAQSVEDTADGGGEDNGTGAGSTDLSPVLFAVTGDDEAAAPEAELEEQEKADVRSGGSSDMADPAQAPQAYADGLPEGPYCGVLTVADPALLEQLVPDAPAADRGGTEYYTVSAEAFEALVVRLDEQGAAYALDRTGAVEGAAQGLVCLEAAP